MKRYPIINNDNDVLIAILEFPNDAPDEETLKDMIWSADELLNVESIVKVIEYEGYEVNALELENAIYV